MSELEQHYKTLWLMAQRGDEHAYRQLLEGLSRLLRSYLTQTMNPRLRSREQVEDLVQEILISIHRKRDLYASDRPLLPWVYAIARYRLIDSIRSEARRPECVEWVENFDSFAFVEMPEIDGEDSALVWMEGLNERQKEVLKLAKIDELSIQEIAGKMGMSLSAVKVTVHRSLKAIRKKLDQS